MATKAKKQPAVIEDAEKKKQEKRKARNNLSGSINAAAVIEAYSKLVFPRARNGGAGSKSGALPPGNRPVPHLRKISPF